MGYLLTVGVALADDEWRDILTIATARGVSWSALPHRATPPRGHRVVLKGDEARELADALEADLNDDKAPLRHVTKDRVEAVVHILRAGEQVHLEETPPWKSGDEPPDIRGERG